MVHDAAGHHFESDEVRTEEHVLTPDAEAFFGMLEKSREPLWDNCTRAGDVDKVVALFADLRTSGTGKGDAASPPPNVLCYNTLVNALAEAGRLEEARVAFDEMLAAGVAPNASSDRKSTRLNSSHSGESRMPSSA